LTYDLAITGGLVVDGTGASARRADVAVRDGRIVAVAETGALEEGARRTIDAERHVVAPGVVDLHTHYDAQLLWDPTASPSPLHGVTSVLGGNCGFSLAPCGAGDIEYVSRLMAKVEGIPLAALDAGLDWEWRSFGDYLDRLEGHIAVNAGFLAGHSGLRRAVLGADAPLREATGVEVGLLASALGEAIDQGALGFSTSQAPTHRDGDGVPVPSRAASWDELRALASECGRHAGTQVELILPGCINGFTDDEMDLMADLSLAAGRPLNWNVLAVTSLNPTGHHRQLEASTRAAARGAMVKALTIPQGFQVRISFQSGIPLDALPGWGPILALPLEERLRALSDPDVRRHMDEGAHSPEAGLIGALANWGILTFFECHTPETRAFEGRRVGEVATEQGQDPFDALMDVVVADRLRTILLPPIPAETDEGWRLRAEVWLDDRSVIGGSDAGAHLDMFCGATYSTVLLGEAVRDRQLLTMEQAIHQLTDVPARLYGLRDRGRVAEGWWADLVVFDPATIGPGPERTRDDLPGGASRLYADATGMTHVLVNGTPIVESGAFTEAALGAATDSAPGPGRVLRSGRDTDTVTIPAGGPTAAGTDSPGAR
jgi:N-acyl-D-aspartate/D-glutamate deacylase